MMVQAYNISTSETDRWGLVAICGMGYTKLYKKIWVNLGYGVAFYIEESLHSPKGKKFKHGIVQTGFEGSYTQ